MKIMIRIPTNMFLLHKSMIQAPMWEVHVVGSDDGATYLKFSSAGRLT